MRRAGGITPASRTCLNLLFVEIEKLRKQALPKGDLRLKLGQHSKIGGSSASISISSRASEIRRQTSSEIRLARSGILRDGTGNRGIANVPA
ncbi:hypothetical protein SB861_40510 [Paraburkholderia sp. SIMBA_049]